MKNKIEKINTSNLGQTLNVGGEIYPLGATFENVIDKINEIIDKINEK